ncbi:Neprosin [Arabidopsis suecica]|uniref:Neprosin n=1 Tax=Arabidopsis suecica TaxID=45249 RepID=A0A8T1Z4P7_ARASU|nr:Neprosin [Arabidopsis suecica]
MEPSFLIPKSKIQVKSKTIIDCPNGTVPIFRNTKEYVANAQYFAEEHFNPITVKSHGTHFAGVRLNGKGRSPFHGMASWISVHNLNVSRDQVSYAHVYVGSRVNNIDNFIETGWMINPSLFGDGRVWGYGYFKGANGTGCYNTICPGFVQVSKTDHISGPLPEGPDGKRNIGSTIQQDKKSGNWWVTDIRYKEDDIPIGYWPKELFDVIGNGVNTLGVGGVVKTSPSGNSPPMGNGHRPEDKDDMASARVLDILVMDSSLKFKLVDRSKLENLLDSDKCYGLRKGNKNLFTFGGEGGDSC